MQKKICKPQNVYHRNTYNSEIPVIIFKIIKKKNEYINYHIPTLSSILKLFKITDIKSK